MATIEAASRWRASTTGNALLAIVLGVAVGTSCVENYRAGAPQRCARYDRALVQKSCFEVDGELECVKSWESVCVSWESVPEREPVSQEAEDLVDKALREGLDKARGEPTP